MSSNIYAARPQFRWRRTVSPPRDFKGDAIGCMADSWPEGPREYLVLEQAWLDTKTGELQWEPVPVVESF
jgi:hypothetical protein